MGYFERKIIYSSELDAMGKTQDTFKNILESAKTALFLRQQLKYLHNKKSVQVNLCNEFMAEIKIVTNQ
jgi:hypothetical protein